MCLRLPTPMCLDSPLPCVCDSPLPCVCNSPLPCVCDSPLPCVCDSPLPCVCPTPLSPCIRLGFKSSLKSAFNYCSNYGTIATYSPIGNTQGWFGPTADSGWNSVLCAAYNIIYWNILCTVLCLYQLSNWCFWYPTYPPPGYFIIQITLVQSKTEQSSVSTVAECCVKTYTFWGHNVLTTNKQILTYCIQFCKHLNGFWYPGCTNISWQVNVYNMFASNTSSIYLM